MPLTSWNKVRVYGTWRRHNGNLREGTYKVTIPARVTNLPSDSMVPAGTYASGALNIEDPEAPSLSVLVPATDDPDNPYPVTPWLVTITVTFPDAAGEEYRIEVPTATPEPGMNLREVILTASFPVQAPMLIRGIAGGVAALDADGDVVDADGAKVTGGTGGGYEPPVDGIPLADLEADVQAAVAKADTAVQPAAIVGFVDASGAAAAAPVQTVAGRAGAVTLEVTDVGDLDTDLDTITAGLVGTAPRNGVPGVRIWTGTAGAGSWSTRPTGFAWVEAYSDGTAGSDRDSAAPAPTDDEDGDGWTRVAP